MSKLILNKENCSFWCPSSPSVSFSVQQVNQTFNDGSSDALTIDTMISGMGNCVIQTAAASGTPVPCSLIDSSSWISGIELNKRINGRCLLNQDAKQVCPFSPAAPVQARIIPGIPSFPHFSNLDSFSGGEISSDTPITDAADTSSGIPNNDGALQNNQTEIPLVTQQNNNFVPTNENDTENDEVINSKAQDCFCNYGNCNKSATCPYANAPDTISTVGAAAKLRKNSSVKYEKYISRTDEIMNRLQISWNNQAHHLISINAAYCAFPLLVKLGNYFGFDINCEENCAFLPCWESGDGYGQKDSHFKKAQAYEVMKGSGLQWHVGQHSYRIDLSKKIMQNYPELRTLKSYNKLLYAKLEDIMRECQIKFNSVCLEENYEVYRKWFIQDNMLALCAEIEQSLELFKTNGKASFPWFVSLEALRYAYEIPRSGKVILINRTQTYWKFRLYHYTNYLRDSDFQLKLLDKSCLTVTDTHHKKTIKRIIDFCENVTCFLVIDELNAFRLPFSSQVNMQYISSDDQQKIKSHFSAMLAESNRSDEDNYISPNAMIHKRMKECGLIDL